MPSEVARAARQVEAPPRRELIKFAIGVLGLSVKARTFYSTSKVSARHSRTTHRCPPSRLRSIAPRCDPFHPHAAIPGQRGVKRVCHLFDRHSLLSMCAQVESGVLETFLVVDNDSSKRRSGRGGSHGGAGRLGCQSPRETPRRVEPLCVHKAGLCQPCMLSGGPLCGASSLFSHTVACVAHINVYLCHIHRVRHQMSAFGGVWFPRAGPRATSLFYVTHASRQKTI